MEVRSACPQLQEQLLLLLLAAGSSQKTVTVAKKLAKSL
jgi:hypothetical protein